MAFDDKWTDDDYFPKVDPGVRPVGNRIVVQLRQAPEKATSSGIILVQETKDTEKAQTMIGKLISIGPIAFKKRDSGEAWPEGVWANPGDIVRFPKWTADRFNIKHPTKKDEEVTFCIFNDHEIIAVVTGQHTEQRAFL